MPGAQCIKHTLTMAAPVLSGMMLLNAERPARQSLPPEAHSNTQQQSSTQKHTTHSSTQVSSEREFTQLTVQRNMAHCVPLAGPSLVSWLAVTACTVVMRPSAMPKLSFSTCMERGFVRACAMRKRATLFTEQDIDLC